MEDKDERDDDNDNKTVLMINDSENETDLDRGWSWVVLVASFGSFCLFGTTMYSMGIIHTALLDRYKADVSTTSWASALHSGVSFICAPLSSYVIDRVSCRMAIILSGIFYTTGFFLTAFAPNIYVAIITNGLIAGLGTAYGYTACLVVIGFNFKRYRSIANGVVFSGVGTGMFCSAPVLQLAITHYGNCGFFIILAAMSANIVTFGMLCIPSKLEIRTHKMRQNDILSDTKRGKESCPFIRGYLNAIINKAIFCMCLCMFIYHCGLMTIFLYLPSLIISEGLSPIQAAFIVSFVGVASAFSRIITGLVANLNIIPDGVLFSAPLIIVSVITFCLPVLPRVFLSYLLYSLCLGLSFGVSFVVIPSLTLTFVTIQYLSTSLALQILFFGIGSLVGPVFAGVLVDYFGSYNVACIFAGTCCAVAFILGLTLSCFSKTEVEGVLHNGKTTEVEVILETSETSYIKT